MELIGFDQTKTAGFGNKIRLHCEKPAFGEKKLEAWSSAGTFHHASDNSCLKRNRVHDMSAIKWNVNKNPNFA